MTISQLERHQLMDLKARAKSDRSVAKAARRSLSKRRRDDAIRQRNAAKAKRRIAKKAARDELRRLKALDLDSRQMRKLQRTEFKSFIAQSNAILTLQRVEERKARRIEKAKVRDLRRKTHRVRTRVQNPVNFSFQCYRLVDGIETKYNSDSRVIFTDTLTDSPVRPCNLSRFKCEPVSGTEAWPGFVTEYQNITHPYVNTNATWSYITPYLTRLKHSKLPTSNDADLLIAVGEAEETAHMLSTKLKKSASYGGIKWGWMPLISEIVKVNDAANAVKNSVLDGTRRRAPYNTTDKFTVVTPPIKAAWGHYTHTWDVKVKYRGMIEYENDVLAFYDYMGYHPSPKVFWELVPLSFAIDWILPIGDMLSAMTPSKGWVKAANFAGWRVITAKCTEKRVKLDSPYISAPPSPSVTVVIRELLYGLALEEKKVLKTIDYLKQPKLEQLCDIAFLSEAFYNRTKTVLSPHVYKKKRR